MGHEHIRPTRTGAWGITVPTGMAKMEIQNYRIASLMNLARHKKTHFLHDLSDRGIERFYHDGRERTAWYFDNLQAKRLSGGLVDGAAAIAVIQNSFGIVGLTDHLDDLTQTLSNYYGWLVDPIAARRTPFDTEASQRIRSSEIFGEICKNNHEDMLLFDFVAGSSSQREPVPRSAPALANMIAGDEEFRERDRAWEDFRAQNPDASYAAFQMKRVAVSVGQGKAHNSLGANIVRPTGKKEDFWEAGEKKARKYMKRFDVQPHERVLEYGCGSLRIGAHFIKLLGSECFYGLDVVDEFFEMGKTLVGPELIEAKRPRLAVISPEAVTREPRPVRGLLAFLDPLLGGPALVVKSHDGAIGEREIRHDKADAREQLADVVLDFCHDPSGRGPAVRLILDALIADERRAAGPSR